MESRPAWWLVKAGPHQLYSLGSDPGLAWLVARSAFGTFHTTSRQTSTSTVLSREREGEDHACGVYTWFLNLSRTKSFICLVQRCVRLPPPPHNQHATELWSTCWCSLKGTRMRKRRRVYTKPMVPGTRHPSLSALSNLLLPAIPPLNCGTSR